MKLKHFIKINTREMNKETRALFYSLTKSVMGDLIMVVKSTDSDGNPSTTKMFHKIVEGQNWYIVPLKSCPTAGQIDELTQLLIDKLNMGDFTLESSLVENKDVFNNSVSDDDYSMIAEKFAQKVHEDWLDERVKNGWRYGEERSDESKTHPLVKSWHELSAQEKTIKPEMVREFIDILRSNGFKITKK
jgi:ryanodine receptor 2